MFKLSAPPAPLYTRRPRYPNQARSHQPPPSKAIPITSHAILSAEPPKFKQPPADQNDDMNTAHRECPQRSARTSFSVSSESSFGSASHYYSELAAPHRDTRPRLAALSAGPVRQYLDLPGEDIARKWLSQADVIDDSSPPWASRDVPPHHIPPSHSSPQTARPCLTRIHASSGSPPLWHHAPSHSISLPDLRHIRPHDPNTVAARRRLEDNSTKPFSLDPPPYSDHDIPLPHPYNAAYPHPLTAYASPGVNSSSIRAVRWRETLVQMMESNLDLVKGSILAASDRNINPPALMIPVFEGEGCGIPERLWSRFESMGDNLTSSLLGPPSSSVPPRFAQAGMQVVSTPGGRSGPMSSSDAFAALPVDGFPAVRTNFSNVLRRSSEADSARIAMPTRRPAPQPTPFHKTELCRTWEHEGTCKYGSNCQFAHGLLELRMPVSGMPTPPSTLTRLADNNSTFPQRIKRSCSIADPLPHQPLGFTGAHDFPILRPQPRRQSTPSPIGAERQGAAWKTVPVPPSAAPIIPCNSPFSFADYHYPQADRGVNADTHTSCPTQPDPNYHGAATPITIGQRSSLSSLSASAASFKSASTPSLGHSYATSLSSAHQNSTYPHSEYTTSGAFDTWTEPHSTLFVETDVSDVEAPNWDMLKRSIDATTVRSVWEE